MSSQVISLSGTFNFDFASVQNGDRLSSLIHESFSQEIEDCFFFSSSLFWRLARGLPRRTNLQQFLCYSLHQFAVSCAHGHFSCDNNEAIVHQHRHTFFLVKRDRFVDWSYNSCLSSNDRCRHNVNPWRWTTLYSGNTEDRLNFGILFIWAIKSSCGTWKVPQEAVLIDDLFVY